MFTEKDIPKLAGTIAAGIVLFILMNYMGVGGFAKTGIIVLLALSFFSDKFGSAGKPLRIVFGVVTTIALVFSWAFTKPMATKLQHDLEVASPREIFNPEDKATEENPTLGATAKFQRRPDGRLEPVSVTWSRNEYTGEPLSRPGTKEFWEELNEFYAQKAEERAEKERQKPPEVAFAGNKGGEGGFLTDESRSGIITLTTDAPSVIKDVTANLMEGKSEARYSSYPLEGCAEVYCDSWYFGTQCAPKQLPSLPRKCNKIQYRLANGEKAVLGFNISVR